MLLTVWHFLRLGPCDCHVASCCTHVRLFRKILGKMPSIFEILTPNGFMPVSFSRWMERGSREMQDTLCTPLMTHTETTASGLSISLAKRSCHLQKEGVNKAIGASTLLACLIFLVGPGMEIVSLRDAGCLTCPEPILSYFSWFWRNQEGAEFLFYFPQLGTSVEWRHLVAAHSTACCPSVNREYPKLVTLVLRSGQ